MDGLGGTMCALAVTGILHCALDDAAMLPPIGASRTGPHAAAAGWWYSPVVAIFRRVGLPLVASFLP